MRRNSVLSGFSFSLFVNIPDWTEAEHDCRPFSASDRHQSICMYFRVIQMKVMANTPKIQDVVKIWPADRTYLWAKSDNFVNYSKIPSRFSCVSFNTKKLNRKCREIFALLSMVPDREEYRFIWLQFQFIHWHPWLDKGQAWLQTIQCCSTVTLCKGNIQLADISVEVVRDGVSRDHATEWSGIEGKKQRT